MVNKKNQRQQEKKSYEDMLYLPHPVSSTRTRMAVGDRAAQFSPFAALTGYEEAVIETARLTESFIELDEYEKAALDEKLNEIPKETEVQITYFEPDERKEGGRYLAIRGFIKRVDEYDRCVVMENGQKIRVERIVGIDPFST